MVRVVGAEGKISANMPGSLPAVEVMANGALFAAIGTTTGASTVVERKTVGAGQDSLSPSTLTA